MQLLHIESKSKISIEVLLSIIYILSLLDYLITYLGISVFHIITEANPYMQQFMKLSFSKGFCLRCLFSLIPVLMLKLVEKKFTLQSTYRFIIISVLIIQLSPFILHSVWIFSFF